MRFTFLFLLGFSLSFINSTQAQNHWSYKAESPQLKNKANRHTVPKAYQVVSIDKVAMQKTLALAPTRFTDESKSSTVTINIPNPDGKFELFEVYYAPIMHPELEAKFPEIRSYVGINVNNPTEQIRFDLTPQGFNGMVRARNNKTYFIAPHSQFDQENCIVYYKKDNSSKEPFSCSFDSHNDSKFDKEVQNNMYRSVAGDCNLRTYDLALACTGEYAQFHGGTVPDVMAAFVVSMNRVNGIFETDANLTMILVPDNDDLIFLDGATDPYTNGSGGAMLGENQTTCDNVIGFDNYDIGHVFSTGGGGVAFLQSPCGGNKAGGVTGQGSPVGDPFDVDYVAHEMGHQYGGNHTQNNSCNRSSASVEPGSASTIMGYAGICNPNVQNNSDPYFHAISIGEMSSFINGSGNSCATTTTTGNNNPTADAGADYTIPISTPFVLTGVGGDPDGTASLTYCWEQMDNAVANMPPEATNTDGPAFRSLNPTNVPERYLPNLTDIVNNVTPTWEVLSSVDRSYSWRFTVRDNNPNSGCTAEDDMSIDVDGNSGPFVLNVPNGGECWNESSLETVTWDVANTDQPPVNTATVDILLSTDGGFTYPVTLASGVPNDGSETITVPNNQSTNCRIMVRANNNVYFDISNANFEIKQPSNDFTLTITPSEMDLCAGQDVTFTVDVGATGTFSGNVNLSANGLPSGSTAMFTSNGVGAPYSSNLIISNTGSIPSGDYTFTVSGNGSTGPQDLDVDLNVSNGLPSKAVLTSPTNGASNVILEPTLVWTTMTNVNTYSLDIATDNGYTNIVESASALTANMYTITNSLTPNTTYFWRVRGENTCGNGLYSNNFKFVTANIVCTTFTSSDIPFNLPDAGANTVSSVLSIPASGMITEMEVNSQVDHSWVGDLTISLENAGTSIVLMDRPGYSGSGFGCAENNVNVTFDDEATTPVEGVCDTSDPAIGGILIPEEPISTFDLVELSGDWTMTVADAEDQDGGDFLGWSVDVCYIPAATAPCLTNELITDNPIPNALYQADNTITSTGTVGTGTNVVFDAGQCIELNTDFEVNANADFEAKIDDGCGPNNQPVQAENESN